MRTETRARAAAAVAALCLCSFHAPPSGGALFTLVGEAPGDRFGAALAGVGDVDGDGCADLVVGAPRAAPNGSASGVARVFSGRDGAELFRLEGDTAFDMLGAAVAGAGDVDGDGTPDWIAGAPGGDPPEGSALVVSGASGSVLWSFVGAGAGERYGSSVCVVGDADGDGRADLGVGAPQSDAAGLNAGRVELRSGASGAVLHEFHGATFDLFGTALAAAGDWDGDGFDDLLVGAPLSDAVAFNAGSAFVLSGSDGGLLAAFHGSGVGDQLGQWVASAGDVDGDGRPDALLAIPGADANGIDSGAVELRSAASGALLLRVAGRAEANYLGSVAGVGDVDGDGRPDLLLGAASGGAEERGEALLVRGLPLAPRARFVGRAPQVWLGAAVAGLGDVDGDGRPDLALGAPIHDDVGTLRGYVEVRSGARSW